ncbi:acetolactate synthase small subunit [Hyphomicrobiales bacterium]|jgi:acetolactate synthase-1/3 small subunit|nr:acetolactate synthase small subunit [Hyphomicrobiales bacterium]MDA8892684.1 acetolactate synthase small subunit [Hyphomicrobiales bacterium]MDA9034829.1 acetolactate synthase small subunit [Hyphomicrobiales bacterium]MDA9904734.1 acetolactate synthase small subunit [Hyphomicrobiales bacterium]MDB9926321.1 acetolactate synthase small subunit [Hyphomicrobiales bacterium]|tara:strand:+ start:399 stop:914 length:516 start_codon:yes stop_codon:yes gene_type:complete
MIAIKEGAQETHTFSVLVDNEAGVLARVIGLFAGRGYNIESLTVAEIDKDSHTSRITIVSSGSPKTIAQMKSQLERLVPVHKVTDLTIEGPSVEREMALIKVLYSMETKEEILRLCEIYRAKVVDTTENSFIFELTGAMDKINSFIDLLRPLGLNDISRTGLAAILRGSKE